MFVVTPTGLGHRAQNHRSPLRLILHQLHSVQNRPVFQMWVSTHFVTQNTPLQLAMRSPGVVLLTLLPREAHATSELWFTSGRMKVLTQHQQGRLSLAGESLRDAKPQWPAHLLLQAEVLWGWLLVRKNQGAGCVCCVLCLLAPCHVLPAPTR